MHTHTRTHIETWLYSIILAVSLSWVVVPANAELDVDGHENEEAHGEEGRIELSPEQIEHAETAMDTVGPAIIRETLPLYGQIVANTSREHSVSARFPGVIQSITKHIGDTVRRGETLATVESNDSLKSYPVLASLNGVVVQRSANVGEQTNGRTLFLIGDYSNVWVDLSVFPSDISKVQVGQSVRVASRDASITSEGKIITVMPVGSAANQTTTARVSLDNDDGLWIPGHFVTAEIFLSETEVATVIRDEAIQIIEGETIVFVAGEDGFEVRAITLGRKDGPIAEVLSGIEAGETYVSSNSFTLKSELGKEDAEDGD
jgi:cobalt-zinc-cadmium efflux system membrane fusion protein